MAVIVVPKVRRPAQPGASVINSSTDWWRTNAILPHGDRAASFTRLLDGDLSSRAAFALRRLMVPLASAVQAPMDGNPSRDVDHARDKRESDQSEDESFEN